MKKEKQDKMLAEEINKKNNEIKNLNEKLVDLENEILKFKKRPSAGRRECSGLIGERTNSNLVSTSKRLSQESLPPIKKQQNVTESENMSLEINDAKKDDDLENKESNLSKEDQLIEQLKLKYEQEIKELKDYYEEKLNEKQNLATTITTIAVRFLFF
jgi:DNA repair exonuclease SbcCD ATPase subunit